MIQKIPGDKRISTGPLEVGDNWPGVFIRGDEVTKYTAPIKAFIAILEGGQLPPEDQRPSYVESLKHRLAAIEGFWIT